MQIQFCILYLCVLSRLYPDNSYKPLIFSFFHTRHFNTGEPRISSMLVKSLMAVDTQLCHISMIHFPISMHLSCFYFYLFLGGLGGFPVWLPWDPGMPASSFLLSCHFVISVSHIHFRHLTDMERQLPILLCESQVLKDYSSWLLPGQHICNCYNSKITSMASQLLKAGKLNNEPKIWTQHSENWGGDRETLPAIFFWVGDLQDAIVA